MNAKQIRASKDSTVHEQMIESYKKQMFILGQRMVRKHSEVDQSRAVVAELDQLIHCLKSRVNTNSWIKNVRDEDNINVMKITDSLSQEVLEVESSNDRSPLPLPIDLPVEEQPVYSNQD